MHVRLKVLAAEQGTTMNAIVEAAVNELVAISGHPRDQCLKALAACRFIPDIAFELLMSGAPIPDAPLGGAQGANEGNEDQEMADYGDEGAGGEANLDNYDLDEDTKNAIMAMVNNPNFTQVRARMIQDQNFAATFMAQLAQTQPNVA